METNQASWLKDGVEAIEALAKKSVSVTPSAFQLPLEKPGTYAIAMPAVPGTKLADALTIRVAGPKWHNELLATPDNLVAFIEHREADASNKSVKAGATLEGSEAPAAGVVYVGETGIVYCYDFEDRRDRASTPLILSKPWQWLASPQQPMTQKMLIRTLRILFGSSLPQGSALIAQLRNLKFTNNGQVEANIQHGDARIGKQILNQVTGVDTLPEDFVLFVNVFENFSLSVEVRVALEIDPERQSFEVIPYPNEMQRAMERTLETIRTKFSTAGAPAFLGAVRAGKRVEDE